MSNAEPRAGADRSGLALLVVLCVATFLVTSTGVALAPFLLDLARDLETDLAAIAVLIGLASVAWGVASLIGGALSDRIERKLVLAAGLLVLAGSLLGFALAASYPVAAGWRLLNGVGGGAFMGVVFAAASDRVPPAERGRAFGWIVTGQSLSLVLGVPLVTFLGSLGGWRGATAAQGLATLAVTLAVWLALRPVARPTGRRATSAPLSAVLSPWLVAVLGASAMERLCFAGLAIYLPTYLRSTYGVALEELGLVLALVALGNLAGNAAGAQVADRVPARPLFFGATLAATGLLALPLLLWPAGLPLSIALGFAYALANALGRPALLATLSAVPESVRGTILGLNITGASVGWLSASALGGWLISASGFDGLAALAAGAGVAGCALSVGAWLLGQADGKG